MSAAPPLSPLPARPVEIVPGRGGPVLLSVPHSGRDYAPMLVARSRLGQASLERLEDPFVDRLVAGAIDRGVGAVIARAPRAMIDVNRAPTSSPPPRSPAAAAIPRRARARAGLGVIPTRLAGVGELWRAPIDEAEFERRWPRSIAPITTRSRRSWRCWPKRGASAAARLPFDAAAPGATPMSCSATATGRARRRGWSRRPKRSRGGAALRWRATHPSPGAMCSSAMARPRQRIHALQIEVDRAAYCQRDARTPGVGFGRVALLFDAFAMELGAALSRRLDDAAE